MNLDAERGVSGLRRAFTPECVDEEVARDDLIGVEEQAREETHLPPGAERRGPTVIGDLERPQHAELQHRLTGANRKRVAVGRLRRLFASGDGAIRRSECTQQSSSRQKLVRERGRMPLSSPQTRSPHEHLCRSVGKARRESRQAFFTSTERMVLWGDRTFTASMRFAAVK